MVQYVTMARAIRENDNSLVISPPQKLPPRETLTSSSPVAERPRDALCPSVVSLNKIITRAESFIIVTYATDLSLRNIIFGVTLRLLVIHFVVVFRHQQTPPLNND